MIPRRDLAASQSDIDGALAVLNADVLREICQDLLEEGRDVAPAALTTRLIDRATRAEVHWSPSPLSPDEIDALLAFAKGTETDGYADARDFDACLHAAIRVFLTGDDRTTATLMRALLIPLMNVPIDLGQDELVHEVLTADLDDCAAIYLASLCAVTEPADQCGVLGQAVRDMAEIWMTSDPIRALHQIALTPLPFVMGFHEDESRRL